jgi:hypothetical protein
MAINFINQPSTDGICSTLYPIKFKVSEVTSTTTNILAECYSINPTSGIETQIGGRYRCAPNLDNVNHFMFDGSEIFNSLCAYTLNDYPLSFKLGQIPANTGIAIQEWEEIATFVVVVKFYREYLDATTGLIVVDPTPTNSNRFYVHQGSPEQQWVGSVVRSNSTTNAPMFEYFSVDYDYNNGQFNRFLTNYPIKPNVTFGSTFPYQQPASFVKIHESSSYILNFFATIGSNNYKFSILTFLQDGTQANSHDINLNNSNFMQTFLCGFSDIKGYLTANGAEGVDFANVAYYEVYGISQFSGGGSTFVPSTTRFRFYVDRGCIKNKAYLNFAFKNMFGGYDIVESRGEYKEKQKDKFEEFTLSQGYDNWHEHMTFGKTNWSNTNVKQFSVTTHAMKPENAKHFAEMLSSTDVYVRRPNNVNQKVESTYLDGQTTAKPYIYVPIYITAATRNIENTNDNVTKIKFTFEESNGQRNPRY